MFDKLVKEGTASAAASHSLHAGNWSSRKSAGGKAEVPLRGAIYARFSTGMQPHESVVRQEHACRMWANEHNVTVDADAVFSDEARTGALLNNREELQRLWKLIKRQAFDIVIIEDADRLSRNLGHYGRLFNDFQFHDTLLASTKKGVMKPSDIAIFGFLTQEQRSQLKWRVRDHKLMLARAGSWQSRIPFGYAAVPGKPGELRIDKQQAALVVKAFEWVAGGMAPADVAKAFAEAGEPSPFKDGLWRTTHISRMSTRAGGLVRNPLYAGRMIQGLIEIRHNPETEKSHTRFRAPEEGSGVVIVERLRIVSDELYFQVQELLQSKKTVYKIESLERMRNATRGSASYLLHGLLFCKQCATMKRSWPLVVNCNIRAGSRNLQCSNRRCTSPFTTVADVQTAVLKVVGDELLPAWLERFFGQAAVEREADLRKGRLKTQAAAERKVQKLEKESKALARGWDRLCAIHGEAVMKTTKKDIDDDLAKALAASRPAAAEAKADRGEGIRGLQEALDGLIARGDFRPANEDELRLAAAVRSVIRSISVARHARDYGLEYTISTNLPVDDPRAGTDGFLQIAGDWLPIDAKHLGLFNGPMHRSKKVSVEKIASLRLDEHVKSCLAAEPGKAAEQLQWATSPPGAAACERASGQFAAAVEAVWIRLVTDQPWGRITKSRAVLKRLPEFVENLRRDGEWPAILELLETAYPTEFAEANTGLLKYLRQGGPGE